MTRRAKIISLTLCLLAAAGLWSFTNLGIKAKAHSTALVERITGWPHLTAAPSSVAPAMFANQVVTSTADGAANAANCPGPGCRLRDAIAAVGAGETITFTVTGTITLTSGELVINKNLTIQGPGASLLTVSGNNTSRVFNITAGVTVNISGLAASNGHATNGTSGDNSNNGGPGQDGGGISNSGTLTLDSVVVNNNRAGEGGCNCSIFTQAGRGGHGGGIYNQGTLTLVNTTISNNQGGTGGSGNFFTSGGGRGGLGGGLYNAGTLSVTNSTLNGNKSGTAGAFGGRAGHGAGIYDAGTTTTTITNSTISTNTTGPCPNPDINGGTTSCGGFDASGGGLFASNTIVISNSTIAFNGANAAGGISVNGNVTIKSSIIARNVAGPGVDIQGTVNSEGYNLIENTTNATINETLNPGTNITGVNPQLQPLANNGGPTMTHALLGNSPAQDKGNSFGLTTDQRGQPRPQDVSAIPNAAGGDGSDIGAFEAQALLLNVNSLADTTDAQGCDLTNCTLREAILAANANPGLSVITFSVTGTIKLTGALPDLASDVTISGPGASQLTVQRDTGGDYRIFSIQSGKVVVISGLTATNGRAPDGQFGGPGEAGGAIINSGTLNLTNVVVSNSAAGDGGSTVSGPFGRGGDGGGIANFGTMTLTNCTVSGNRSGGAALAQRGGDGGGIFSASSLIVINSTISGNVTGDGAGNVAFSGVGGNGGNGGGIYSQGMFTLTNSTVSGNQAGNGGRGGPFGGPSNGVGGNGGNGGGIYQTAGTLDITNSTVSGNTAGRGGISNFKGGNGGNGGGINTNNGDANITACTITKNTAGAPGPSISTPGTQGHGGGSAKTGTGTVSVRNTIIADNTVSVPAAGDTPDVFGTHTSQDFNLIGVQNGDFTQPADQSGTLAMPLDPKLGALGPNGGPTQTHSLLANSPAIDKGNSFGLTTDQRGLTRPVDMPISNVGDGADIGAFEVNFAPDLTITKSDNNALFLVGATGQYFITVSNAVGAGSTTGIITVTDNLPTGLSLTSFSGTGWSCSGTSNVTCTHNGPVSGGSSLPQVTLTVSVGPSTALGPDSISNTAIVSTPGETNTGNNSGSDTTTVIGLPAPLAVKLTDPAVCTGPGNLVTVTAQLTNPNPSTQTGIFNATLPAQLPAIAGTCAADVAGAFNNCGGTTVSWTGSLAAGQTVTITYQAQVVEGTPVGTSLCINSTGMIAGITTPFQACTTVNCPAVGPGAAPAAGINVSDQKPGSVLFYNIYTSNPSNLSSQNTRINLTNTDPARSVAVHLFFVDGATCTPADYFVCLTPSQTLSALASDIDPGTTGYIVAVAVDSVTGCPINFNFLIGDEFVKLASGHQSNLAAESFAALTGTPPVCAPGALSATLNFDGVSYNQVPRVLAVDNFASTADGNNTLVILNRVGGNLATGASTIGSLFGVLFDESEQSLSFTLSSSSCQFRFPLTNASLRTVQRLESVVGPGRTGWLRLWGVSDIGLLGSVINLNTSAGVNNFNQGHNLHKLTFTSASLTIPIFPPNCQ